MAVSIFGLMFTLKTWLKIKKWCLSNPLQWNKLTQSTGGQIVSELKVLTLPLTINCLGLYQKGPLQLIIITVESYEVHFFSLLQLFGLITAPILLVVQNCCQTIDLVPHDMLYPCCQYSHFILQTAKHPQSSNICHDIWESRKHFNLYPMNKNILISVDWDYVVNSSCNDWPMRKNVNSMCHASSKASILSIHYDNIMDSTKTDFWYNLWFSFLENISTWRNSILWHIELVTAHFQPINPRNHIFHNTKHYIIHSSWC